MFFSTVHESTHVGHESTDYARIHVVVIVEVPFCIPVLAVTRLEFCESPVLGPVTSHLVAPGVALILDVTFCTYPVPCCRKRQIKLLLNYGDVAVASATAGLWGSA